MKKLVPFLLTLLVTGVMLVVLSTSFGPLPPTGAFFQPTQGFWANAETRDLTGEIDLNLNGPTDSVEVFFDERGVPHIFAQNDEDLYYAQGYITARDRLFQMELQIRAAGGQLAEWLGPDLVEYDRGQRRLGMMYGAEKSLEGVMANDTIRTAVESYTDGINAYINTLRYETYPLEYKILNASPEQWKPINTALLLKYMTQMLAGRSDDVRTSNTAAYLGKEFVNEFLSTRPDLMDPIVPAEKEWDFEANIPGKPDSLFQPVHTQEIEHWKPDPLNGSNNWVVDGSKTAGGYPILSNDMHLNMSMPSIWYEIQLQTPESNTYGVSLQGTPMIIVGFNENIAWGSTNTGADVMDWYEVEFRDDDKEEYLHDGEWLPVTKRTEVINVKGGESITDTLLFTHHGPVHESKAETTVNEVIQQDHALRWIGHEESNELLTFYKLNRAEGYEDFRDAFRSYTAPAQNMNYGGTDGNIAIQTGGKFPMKWEFQGRTVSDGSDSKYDWNEFIPYEQNPFSLNPERGFLSAANQYPTAEDYPYYLGESFAPYERGRRINDLLRDMDNITVTDFQKMLMDDFSYHAYQLLPVLLDEIHYAELNQTEQKLIDDLQNWNYEKKGDAIEPSVFREWWSELYSSIWDPMYDTHFPMRYPSRDVTVDYILNNPDSDLFDNVYTNETETLSDLIQSSFITAVDNLENRFGEFGDGWKWGFVSNTNLGHVGQIPGLGQSDVFTNGGAETINAIRGSHGPSWRMIVELDPDGVRGYGVYPGGQSGNPGSKTYDEFVETWRTGELYELLFLTEKPNGRDDFPLVIQMR
ncbi:MAG: penicillin acylase family protein [Balneolaceae bacterium]